MTQVYGIKEGKEKWRRRTVIEETISASSSQQEKTGMAKKKMGTKNELQKTWQ